MCLIKDDQIPVYASDMVNLFFSKLVGANYNVLFVIKRITICIGKNTVEIFGLQNYRWKKKLFLQFHTPLLSQCCWGNNKNMAMSLGPLLGDNKCGFNCFSKPYFVGKDGAHAQRRFESKKSCIHLMRIQIYLSFCKHTGKFILITRRSTTSELPCKKLLLIGSQCWYVINLCHNLNN